MIDLHQNDRKMAMKTQVSLLSGQSFPHDTHTATVLHLSTTMSRGRGLLCCVWLSVVCGCPLCHRMFSSIPGPYPAPRIMTTKDVSGHCQMFPGRQNHPRLRTSTLEDWVFITFFSTLTVHFQVEIKELSR